MSGWNSLITEFCNDMATLRFPSRRVQTNCSEKFVHILNEIEKLNQEIEHGLIEHSLEEN